PGGGASIVWNTVTPTLRPHGMSPYGALCASTSSVSPPPASSTRTAAAGGGRFGQAPLPSCAPQKRPTIASPGPGGWLALLASTRTGPDRRQSRAGVLIGSTWPVASSSWIAGWPSTKQANG